MRIKSTNYYDRISRRTSIQALLLFFTHGVMAATNHAADTSGLAAMPGFSNRSLLHYPGVLPPAFFATKPFQGVTHFDNAVMPPPANLLPATASPATITDVGNPAIYPGVGALATGWDFTLTASAGNVTAAFTGNGASGTIPASSDYCVRLNRSLGGATLQTVGIKTDDHSLVQLLSIYLKLNLVPNNASSLCDITLQGYKTNTAVVGATKTITGMQTQVWTQFDVSTNASFIGVDEFRFTSSPASGVVVSSMMVDEIALPTTPLPLTLTAFSGHRDGSDVLLDWNTASEQNTASFEIQRSTDGLSFSAIGSVPAAGNSSDPRNYSYKDANIPSISGNYFYRLKMTDLDGKYTYSQVLAISTPEAGFSLSAYPNPFRQQLNISVMSPETDKASVIVRDISGKIVLTKNINLIKGSNVLTIPALSQLEKGSYLMTVSTSQHRQSVNILKMD